MTRGVAALCGVVGRRAARQRERSGRAAWSSGPSTAAASRRSTIRRSSKSTRATSRILKVAWRWYGGNFGPTPEMKSETTPLMIGGVLYATAGATRNVVAIDAGSGETLWIWRPNDGERFRTAPRRTSGRGVAYWSDGADDRRVFTVTPGFYLVSLDAETGLPKREFGEAGIVDLRRGLRGPMDNVEAGSSSPPLVVGDVVVVGSRGRRRRAAEREDASEARRARLRCAHGPAAVDVSHDSGDAASSATTPGSRRARPSTPATAARGARCPPTPSSGSCTCPSKARRATCTAASVTATTCSRTASSPST